MTTSHVEGIFTTINANNGSYLNVKTQEDIPFSGTLLSTH